MLRHMTVRSRSTRLLILLSVLSVLHAFDLALTQAQLERDNFCEANGLAAVAAQHVPFGLAAYKTLLFGTGVAILYAVRRHWQAECGAWLLLVVSAGLMLWWRAYLGYVDICLADPAAVSPALAF